MKTIKLLSTILVIFTLMPAIGNAREISLYDDAGEAVAYIDTDDEMNIYLWKGRSVAYLDDESVYGFNGKHLGWFKKGIIWDRKGYVVGFIEGAVSKLTKLERLKGLQKLTPLKSLQQLEPLEPLQKTKWGKLSLEIFLSFGAK
ncbi:MAG: hypothetical protein HRU04_05600 [Oceanospirillaceae bacterium]|nr:hypothetical protein [Oceanospirillaceae bacterium]